MRRFKWLVPIILIIALALVFTLSVAGAPPNIGMSVAPSFAVTWSALAGGGGAMHSNSYILLTTVGQPVGGGLSSASYRLQTGYWAGVWPYRNIMVPLIEK